MTDEPMQPVMARMPETLYAEVKRIAEQDDRSVSWVIRRAVAQFVADPTTAAALDDYLLVLREDFDLVRACVDNDHWPVKFHHLAVGVLLDNAELATRRVFGEVST